MERNNSIFMAIKVIHLYKRYANIIKTLLNFSYIDNNYSRCYLLFLTLKVINRYVSKLLVERIFH